MLGHSHVIPGMVRRKSVATTPAQIIFHRMYPVRISGIYLVNEDIQAYYGSVTTGDSRDDVAMASALRVIQVPIAGMAVFLAEGATFSLVEPAHANEIFEIVHQHLMNWVRSVDNSFNKRSAPLKGLRQLEELSEYLYPHAMRQRNATQPESHLYKSLRDMIANRSSFRREQEVKNRKLQDAVIKPFHSLADDLSQELQKRG